MKKVFFIIIAFILNSYIFGQTNKPTSADTVNSNVYGDGALFEIEFIKGKSHNKPSFVVWIDSPDGKYLQTLFVTKSVNKGNYTYGKNIQGKWHASYKEYPAALPFWFHRIGKTKYKEGKLNTDATTGATKKPDYYVPGLVPDAYSGATPKSSFVLNAKAEKMPERKIRLLLEVNQTWDWNDFWHNTKYMGDQDYQSSCQPAVVYAVDIDLDNLLESYILNPIGHSHYSGKDGNLYTDLSTLTTALQIFDKITVKIKK